MKTFRAQRGPFEKQVYFSADEIDQMCLVALGEEFVPKEPEPIRIERFIEKHFKCRIIYEILPDGVLGCTAFNKDGSVKAVFISTTIDDGHISSERRIRATLAHEGGHCLMHGSLFLDSRTERFLTAQTTQRSNIDFSQQRILCRPKDINATSSGKRYDGRWWEWQANRAIGGFLLPKSLVRLSLAKLLQASPVTESPVLPARERERAEKFVAEKFDVNPAVARIRLAEMYPPQTGQLEF